MKKTQINELRSVLRQYIKEEMDTVAAENDIEDAFEDLESQIDKLDLDAPESEALGLTIAGVALSMPQTLAAASRLPPRLCRWCLWRHSGPGRRRWARRRTRLLA